MSNNPFDSKNMLLAALGVAPESSSAFGSLSPYAKPPEPSAHSARSLAALVEALGSNPPGNFGSGVAKPQFGNLAPNSTSAIAELLNPSTPRSPLAGLSDYFTGVADPQTNPFSPFGVAPPMPVEKPRYSFDDLINPPASGFGSGLAGLGIPYQPPKLPVAPPVYAPPLVKRRSYFAFNYADVRRSVIVRNAWRFQTKTGQDRAYFDSSIWEKTKVTDPVRLRKIITAGMKNSSAVCVLAGSETFRRPFVRYEIALAVIDGRGLLTVHVNDIPHVEGGLTHPRGPNPLDYMGVMRCKDGLFRLAELNDYADGQSGVVWRWEAYSVHTGAVTCPRWLTKPDINHVMPLSVGADEYDYTAGNGHKNIGIWIDRAAQRAGR